jgi:uncharacterized membrane protein
VDLQGIAEKLVNPLSAYLIGANVADVGAITLILDLADKSVERAGIFNTP